MPRDSVDMPATLRQLEDSYIDTALARTRGNKKAAADLLGLKRTTLVEKLRRRRPREFGKLKLLGPRQPDPSPSDLSLPLADAASLADAARECAWAILTLLSTDAAALLTVAEEDRVRRALARTRDSLARIQEDARALL